MQQFDKEDHLITPQKSKSLNNTWLRPIHNSYEVEDKNKMLSLRKLGEPTWCNTIGIKAKRNHF